MTQSNDALAERRPAAKTDLTGFPGPGLFIAVSGHVAGANERGHALLAELPPDSLDELKSLVTRDSGGLRLDRFSGPAGGDPLDVMLLPLDDGSGVLALVVTNPAESALRRALIESRQRYRDLVEAACDFVWETDRHGRFSFLSSNGALGYAARDLLGKRAADFVVDASPHPYPIFQTRRPVMEHDVWMLRADGQISCQAITSVPILDADGEWAGSRGMGRDVTELRDRERAEKQRALRDRLMTYLHETIHNEVNPERTLPAALSGTGLAIGADGGLILNGHPGAPGVETMAWGAILTAQDIEAVQTDLIEHGTVDVLRGGLHIVGHVTLDRPDDTGLVNGAMLFWSRAETGGFSDGDRSILGDVAGQIGLAVAHLRQYREMVVLSNTDGLTGLLNRRSFLQDLERRLHRLATAEAGTGALIFLDINNLKIQNDIGGHLAGDRAILTCAEILKNCTRGTDLLGRVGGDEFLIWLDGIGEDIATARAQTLLRHAERLSMLSVSPERPLGVSLGVAIFDGEKPETSDRLIARADAAMYEAKSRSSSGWKLAQPGSP
jgi:diguanylate cyclase (GGDEF)-like protein/PAS domain S-box-containing protein